jgi:predicted RNase H-like nuclease (RuvC/YqgF family)
MAQCIIASFVFSDVNNEFFKYYYQQQEKANAKLKESSIDEKEMLIQLERKNEELRKRNEELEQENEELKRENEILRDRISDFNIALRNLKDLDR